MNKLLTSLLLTFFLAGCMSSDSKYLEYDDYVVWVAKNKDHISKIRENHLVSVKAEFQPSELLAYHEYQRTSNRGESDYKAILEKYKCGISFKITVAANDPNANLLNHEIANYADYSKRISYLSFQIEEFTSITSNGQTYKPVLAHFEGYNEFSNRLIFHTVFQPDEFACGQYSKDMNSLRLTFEDEIWGSGTNHFTFQKGHLENLPKLILAKN
ncbi:MAG: hypothetical protein AAFQ94_21290 [Bacteroidota bacterium]